MRSGLKSFVLFVLTCVATSLLCASATAQTVRTPAPVAPIQPPTTVEPAQQQSPKVAEKCSQATAAAFAGDDGEGSGTGRAAGGDDRASTEWCEVASVSAARTNEPGSIATITPEDVNADAHASIIAGVALEDGKTIVARLPQVAAEMEIQRFQPAGAAG